LFTEPRQGIAIAVHAQCKMNIVDVVRLVTPEHRLTANVNVELLLSIADLVPDSRIIEGRSANFLHFQDATIELSRTLYVLDGNEHMMQIGFNHGGVTGLNALRVELDTRIIGRLLSGARDPKRFGGGRSLSDLRSRPIQSPRTTS